MATRSEVMSLIFGGTKTPPGIEPTTLREPLPSLHRRIGPRDDVSDAR